MNGKQSSQTYVITYINSLDNLKILLDMGIIILPFFLLQTHYCMYKSAKA